MQALQACTCNATHGGVHISGLSGGVNSESSSVHAVRSAHDTKRTGSSRLTQVSRASPSDTE